MGNEVRSSVYGDFSCKNPIPSGFRGRESRVCAGAAADGQRRRLSHLTVVVASTGGPGALYQLLSVLPAPLKSGLIIVQHMPAGFTASLASHLDRETALQVREAADGDFPQDGLVLVAPGVPPVIVSHAARHLGQ